jgi:hypothetical protein
MPHQSVIREKEKKDKKKKNRHCLLNAENILPIPHPSRKTFRCGIVQARTSTQELDNKLKKQG